MDVLVVLGAIAAIVGIVAGIVQVLDYLQKRRERRPESQREIEAKPADHASPDPYNIAAIRNLLRDAFTATEFRRFCQDRPLLEPLLSRFGPDASLQEMIDVAIEYCQKRSLLSELLTEVKAFNPRQWERHRDLVHQHRDLVESRIPENLDPRSGFFVGREAEKAEVHEALRRSRLVCIEGIGGIGKTAMALEVAHECLRDSRNPSKPADVATFAGFIWVSAKDRDVALEDILDEIARTLGYVGISQRPLDEKRVAVCDLLRAKPYLLIVDNYETIVDEDVGDFLIKLSEPSKALITSRGRDWSDAEVVSLQDLSQPESFELMRTLGQRLGLGALERGSDPELLPLYQATQGVPLAIKWAIGQIRQRGQSLDTVLLALQQAQGSIFDSIFGHSWDLTSPDAKSILMLMPLFVTSASREGIQAASDIHHFALDEALGQLVEMSLLDASDELELARRRYSIHPLTRAFSTPKLQRAPEIKAAAQQRLLEYYQSFASIYGGFWNRAGDAVLGIELPNVLAALEWCWEQHAVKLGVDILSNITQYLLVQGSWSKLIRITETAISCASEAGDEATAARLRVWTLAWINYQQGKWELAEEMTRQALVTLEGMERTRDVAFAKRNLARIAQRRGAFEEAEVLFRQSLAFFTSVNDQPFVLYLTNGLINLYLEQARLADAWALCNDILPSARDLQNPELLGILLHTTGVVAHRRGDLPQAKALCEEALDYLEKTDSNVEIANVLFDLAPVDIKLGQEEEAKEKLARAADIYRRLGMQLRAQEASALLESSGDPEHS